MQGRPAAGVLTRRLGERGAPKSIPIFKPVPFKQDKFLSIKSRTSETYFNTRRQILRRSEVITEEIGKSHPVQSQEQRTGESVSGNGEGSDRFAMSHPLTAHMAAEVDAWNNKVRSLEAHQGFVLSDELVFEAISRNIHWGAPPYVLDWLRKAARESRIPVPAALLRDVATFVNSVQSSLPSSTSSLMLSPDMITEDGVDLKEVGESNDERDVDAKDHDEGDEMHSGNGDMNGSNSNAKNDATPNDEDDGDEVEDVGRMPFVNSAPYVRFLLNDLLQPIWESMSALGFLPCAARAIGVANGDSHVRSVNQTIDPLPFLSWGESVARENLQEDKETNQNESSEDAVRIDYACEVMMRIGVPSTLRGAVRNASASAVLDAMAELLLSFAYCAAEAKEVHLLVELQLVFCALFVNPQRTGNPNTRRLRRDTWCANNGRDDAALCTFASDFLSATYYGRQAYQNEVALAACLESTLPINDTNEKASSALLQRRVDATLTELFQGESSALVAARPYAAMALRHAALLPDSSDNFPKVELRWMRLHCEACVHAAESSAPNVQTLMDPLFQPNGALATALASATHTSVTDRHAFLALATGTMTSIVAHAPFTARRTLAAHAMRELFDRAGEEVWPLRAAAMAAVLLIPAKDAERLRVLLRHTLNQPMEFGNAYGVWLLVLAKAGMWDEVRQLLRVLLKDDTSSLGLSSVWVDQQVWAFVFRAARDAGEADVCVQMRSNREKLFY